MKLGMRVLALTNMYPTPKAPSLGTFVELEVKSLEQEGIEVDVLFINGVRNQLSYLWAFPRFWARLLTRKYDLIHAHYVFTGLVARAQFGYPVVLTHHGAEVFQTWQAPLSRAMNRVVDRIIVRTAEMKEKMGWADAYIVPAGVDFDMFKPMSKQLLRKELGLPLTKKLVLYAGEYWRPEKRYDIVQQAFPLLKQEVPDAELVLVTKQPLSTVPKYMNACDAIVLVSDAEGSPNVIKEAMACNLPIVSVPAGDVQSIIGDTSGCYFCSQEPADVAEKLRLALSFGKRTNGRDRLNQLALSLPEIARKIISIYEDVLREKRPAASSGPPLSRKSL